MKYLKKFNESKSNPELELELIERMVLDVVNIISDELNIDIDKVDDGDDINTYSVDFYPSRSTFPLIGQDISSADKISVMFRIEQDKNFESIKEIILHYFNMRLKKDGYEFGYDTINLHGKIYFSYIIYI